MYNNYLFQRDARRRRTKALVLTVLIHLFFIGSIACLGNADVEKYIPLLVKQWLGNDVAAERPAAEVSLPQP